MKKLAQLGEVEAKQSRRLVLAAGTLTTLLVWSTLDDPINIPKMFLLSIFAAWLTLGILVAAMVSDLRYTAFYGAPQRHLGAFSYWSLAVVAFASMASFTLNSLTQIRSLLFYLGIAMGLYALVQSTGHDLFSWVLLYGPVVGTLGNPDFASGLLGVTTIAALWVVVNPQGSGARKIQMRVLAGFGLVVELLAIKKTGSIQGFAAFALGLTSLVIILAWQKRKYFGYIALGVAAVGVLGVVAGLLNKGPFAARIYQSTLLNRLDYWKAAWSAFKAHPLFGIGLDRFGEYYGQYAPQIQVVENQGTDNAHNVFLQLLATGGLVVVLPYLLLLGVIFWAGLRAVIRSKGNNQIHLGALFAIWLALLAISTISIDNLGIAIWLWIAGGALYAASAKNVGTGKNSPSATLIAPIAGLVFSVIALVVIFPVWKTSALVFDLQRNRGALSEPDLKAKVDQLATINSSNVQALINATDFALQLDDKPLALSYAKKALALDPRSYYGNYLSALANEMQGKFAEAIDFRVKITQTDIWNTNNMLELTKDYVKVKDLSSAKAMASKIATLKPESDNAKAALALLNG
ncbi:MAG: O-antigen ligase family protein [Actinobacteria bacterium]|nr:O-antigen ligase family protein [Actinomycetota bacterium]